MMNFSRWRAFFVILLAALSVYYASPNAFSPDFRLKIVENAPSWIPDFLIPHRSMTLGLDLQGGMYVALEVNAPALREHMLETLQNDVRTLLRETRTPLKGGLPINKRSLSFRMETPEKQLEILKRLQTLVRSDTSTVINTATIAQKDDRFTLTLTDGAVREKSRLAIEQSLEIFRRRIDPEGTKEISIQRQGINRIIIQIPGSYESSNLRALLGKVAKLEFHMVADPLLNPGAVRTLPAEEGGTITIERRTLLDGGDLTSAEPSLDPQTGEPVVNFRFNINGAKKFAEITSRSVGKPFAIVLDGIVISAPVIRSPILGGQGQISGNFTLESANRLAVLLRSGALPAAFDVVEERVVGPGLGQDSIDAGKYAAYSAIILVLGFMLFTYGLFGVFANLALIIHILMIVAVMTLLGATLTLPGIAGIVLTIGTAVDANVLIYERIREESRAGRTPLAALEAGFTRALSTIIDSNATMFIVAVILYMIGSGPVRGFAVTMIIGIITTVVTAVTMTRLMISTWRRYAQPTRIPL